MPFLLIPVGTVINILGLYSKYILAGAYVCKLFDYAVQCSPKENKRRQCTINYTHIGYRYTDLFPFTIEQSGKKRIARGTTKKDKRSKRKTRKQQKKEIDKREKYRKVRRSKNKNKSKKYGARSL
jgi:hypothetical protein